VKEKICRLVCVLLLGIVVSFPSMVIAHGGGGGGGGGGGSEDGGAYGTTSGATDEYLMGGGVSWTPNPNGPGARGSSIFSGRPDNIEKGPYQPDVSIEDAEAILLAEYAAGNYTPEELIEQLEWADRVGLNVSDDALQVLDEMAEEMQQLLDLLDEIDKQEAEVSTQETSSTGGAWTEKQQDNAVTFLNIAAGWNKASDFTKQMMTDFLVKHNNRDKRTSQEEMTEKVTEEVKGNDGNKSSVVEQPRDEGSKEEKQSDALEAVSLETMFFVELGLEDLL